MAAICEAAPDDLLIVDGYGRELTGREFVTMLHANCPIQFTDHIGAVFS